MNTVTITVRYQDTKTQVKMKSETPIGRALKDVAAKFGVDPESHRFVVDDGRLIAVNHALEAFVFQDTQLRLGEIAS